MFMYSGDGAVGPVDALAALLQEAVQLVLEVWVSQFWLLEVEVCEAEGGGGAQARSGGQ